MNPSELRDKWGYSGIIKSYWIRLHASQHKKWSFLLRISSVNVAKFIGNCGFGHIYWRNPEYKTSFSSNSTVIRVPKNFCYLQKYFYKWNITMDYCFIGKIDNSIKAPGICLTCFSFFLVMAKLNYAAFFCTRMF